MTIKVLDAVRIVQLPGEQTCVPVSFSQMGITHIQLGDVGLVVREWNDNKLQVNSVDSEGRICWQGEFIPDQLKIVPVTQTPFNRRRFCESWAGYLTLGDEWLDDGVRQAGLSVARKVMQYAKHNIEVLIERLDKSGYIFANPDAVIQPFDCDLTVVFNEYASHGFYVPIALQAFLMEIGCVDLMGTHPQWPRSAYAGVCDNDINAPHWYTDPLHIWFYADYLPYWLQERRESNYPYPYSLEIAPDVVHKANYSGGAPVIVNLRYPTFDVPLGNQRGSLTLYSYLKLVFQWGGFPGFEYIHDAPIQMITELTQGLIRF